MNANGGPVLFKTKGQVVQQFMGGFFQWLAQNGIPNPHQELCQIVLYVNLFADYREQIKEGLKRERDNMTADILTARRAFNLLQLSQGIPPTKLEKALAELSAKYNQKPDEGAAPSPEANPVPEADQAQPDPNQDVVPDNVVQFPGGETKPAEDETKPDSGETTGPEGEPQEV